MTRNMSKGNDEIGSIRESYLLSLAQGIRHEIVLPIAQISQLAKISKKHIDDLLDGNGDFKANARLFKKLKKNLDLISTTSAKTSTLAEHLLVLSKSNFERYESVDLNSLIRDEIDELKRDKGVRSSRIVLSFDFQDPELIGAVYKAPFLALVRNLALNAIESMEGKRGRVTVRTYTKVIFPEEKEHFYVQFDDEGCGISFRNPSDIFVGGLTTKQGPFRGWGLWLGKLCLGQMNGRAFVRKRRPSGTSITIRLPK